MTFILEPPPENPLRCLEAFSENINYLLLLFFLYFINLILMFILFFGYQLNR